MTGLPAPGLAFSLNAFDSAIAQPHVQGQALRVSPIPVVLAVIGGSAVAGGGPAGSLTATAATAGQRS